MMILYKYVLGQHENERTELRLLTVVSKIQQSGQEDEYYIRSGTGAMWIATQQYTLKEFPNEVTMKEAREEYPEYFL